MYEIYQRLLDEKGLKNADVARATGISNMTLSDWKRGKSVPKSDKMQKIAEFLNVSVDYLMTGEEKEVPTFSTEHIELISAYDKLSSADKLAIMQIIKSLSEK